MNSKPHDTTDELPAAPPKAEFTIRCPRLGHEINFTYCRSEDSGLPCFKTLDCWHSHFNVHTYLKDKLTEDDFKRVFLKKTKPKVLSLLDLIEQAKERKRKKD